MSVQSAIHAGQMGAAAEHTVRLVAGLISQ